MKHTLSICTLLLAVGLSVPPVAAAADPPAVLTFKQAIDLALLHSQDVALAEAQQRVSAAEVRSQRSVFGPNVYTGTGAVYTYGFPQTPGGGAPSVLNLSYVQTLFNRSSRGQLNAAEARLHGRGAGVDQTRDAVIAQTAGDYFELASVRQAVASRRTAQASANRIVAITRDLVAAGRDLPAAAIRAEIEAAQIAQSLVQLGGREGIVEEQLRTLIGLPPGRPIQLEQAVLPARPPETLSALVAKALHNNPGLREAEDERQARQAALKGAQGAYWPSVDLVGQYGLFSRYNNFDQYFQKFQRNNVNVGIEVQVPIFSAQTSAAAALAASQVAEADGELQQKRAALTLDVRQQAERVRERTAALDVARLQAKLADETLRELNARYQAGFVSLRDVARARIRQSDAEVALLDARLAAEQAQLALWTTTGQLGDLAH